MGRAAKLAALKLRVSRAGAPYVKASGLRQAPDTPREPSGKLQFREALQSYGKEFYNVTRSAKPTFREVRGHECRARRPPKLCSGNCTELPSSQWLFYQRKAACAVSVPQAASSFPGTARALLVLSQLHKASRSFLGFPELRRHAPRAVI